MKRILIILVIIIIVFLGIYPFLEFDTGSRIIKFSYSDDTSLFEDRACYDESYFYNKKRDVSIYEFKFYKFLFFQVISMDYKLGNVCDSEYVLEEKYIKNFLDNAIIIDNPNNIDLGSLIKGKTAIVGNKKYYIEEYDKYIKYLLDGEEEILYVSYIDDLLVIQVGLSDEGAKYIAYE